MPRWRRSSGPWPMFPAGPRRCCRPDGTHNHHLSPTSRWASTFRPALPFMASNLDLQEQEQLDELKAFWNQYGNLVTWTVTLVLAAFAAWNGWNWWQREQGGKASVMFDELDRAVQTGDAAMAGKVFNDLRE